MRNPRPSIAFVIIASASSLLATTGCDRIRSALGKGDGGETAASEGSGGPGPLAFLNGFEGEVDVLATGHLSGEPHHGAKPAAEAPVHIVAYMKSGKVRVDVPPGMHGAESLGKAYGIYDGPAQKAYVVMEAQKQAILIDLNKAGDHLKTASASHPSPGGGGTGSSRPPPKVVKTGQTDKVAGYTCEIWEITDESSKASLCIANEGISWFHMPLTGAPAEYAWMAELTDGKHIPLRYIGFDKTGAEEGRVEITKIDKKSEPDTVFEVPPGYKIVTLEQMFQAPPGAGGHLHPPHQ